MEDSQIIALLFERSERAIDELEQKYGKAVMKTATNILRSRRDAEECANDTWLAVWDSIPPHRPDPLGSYVCRIARNTAVSKLRSETAQKRNGSLDLVLDELEDCIPSAADVEADYDCRETVEAINRFLAALDYDDRYLFVRRYWFADSVKEIAAAMHQRESRVSVRLFRLREKLRKTLIKEGLLV
ncbi:MAG: RNA polymerase sigma factor [Clostridia bacterium]